MNIVGDSNIFVRNIVDVVIKGSQFNLGTIYNGTLYVVINYGILYVVDVSNFFPLDVTCTFDGISYKDTKEMNIIIDRPELFNDLYKRIHNLVERAPYSPLIYDNENIREDPLFEEIINAKTSEGSFRYFIDTSIGRTFIILYKSIFGLAKPDTLSLKIHDYSSFGFGTRLAHFVIGKKKLKINIHVYFVFVDMIFIDKNRSGG